MIDNKTLISIFKTADLHAKRLRFARTHLQPLMPISGEQFSNLTEEQIPLFDSFSERFCKLQDLLGAKLFESVLEWAQEPLKGEAFLDKLYALEKLRIIPDANKWKELREVRNKLSHEYPDDANKNANYVNEAFEWAAYLLDCLERFKQFVNKQASKAGDGDIV
jgi:hypothetical protein